MKSFPFQTWLNSLCLYKFYICAQIVYIHFWSLNRAQTLHDSSPVLDKLKWQHFSCHRSRHSCKWYCAHALCLGLDSKGCCAHTPCACAHSLTNGTTGSCSPLGAGEQSKWSRSLLKWHSEPPHWAEHLVSNPRGGLQLHEGKNYHMPTAGNESPNTSSHCILVSMSPRKTQPSQALDGTILYSHGKETARPVSIVT